MPSTQITLYDPETDTNVEVDVTFDVESERDPNGIPGQGVLYTVYVRTLSPNIVIDREALLELEAKLLQQYLS